MSYRICSIRGMFTIFWFTTLQSTNKTIRSVELIPTETTHTHKERPSEIQKISSSLKNRDKLKIKKNITPTTPRCLPHQDLKSKRTQTK